MPSWVSYVCCQGLWVCVQSCRVVLSPEYLSGTAGFRLRIYLDCWERKTLGLSNKKKCGIEDAAIDPNQIHFGQIHQISSHSLLIVHSVHVLKKIVLLNTALVLWKGKGRKRLWPSHATLLQPISNRRRILVIYTAKWRGGVRLGIIVSVVDNASMNLGGASKIASKGRVNCVFQFVHF